VRCGAAGGVGGGHNAGVFDLGLPGYRPCWLRGRQELTSRHGHRLRSLVGRRLHRTWVVWDLDADAWFPDCPVVLDLSGEHLEVNHRRFDELSLSWNTIDLTHAPDWAAAGSRLVWRDDAPTGAAAVSGAVVESVALLDWDGDGLSRGSVAVGLRFPAGWLTVYNACDENGVAFGPLDPAYGSTTPSVAWRSVARRRPSERAAETGPAEAERAAGAPGAVTRPGRARTCTITASAAWIHNRRPSSPT
jgi:hypothetical protein